MALRIFLFITAFLIPLSARPLIVSFVAGMFGVPLVRSGFERSDAVEICVFLVTCLYALWFAAMAAWAYRIVKSLLPQEPL